jgi:hypothetical protein
MDGFASIEGQWEFQGVDDDQLHFKYVSNYEKAKTNLYT